jgi:hypothetical protein
MRNPIITHEYAKARQSDLLKEAEARRVARQAKAARPAQPSLVERIVDGVGTLLIDAGRRLTDRNISPQSEALKEA